MLGVLQTTSISSDDAVAIALVAATGFFLAIAFGLLYRYRQASQRLNASTDLGRDLWEALNQRMRRQDERIVDLMARVEVLQARVTSSAPVPPPLAFPAPAAPLAATPPTSPETKPHEPSQQNEEWGVQLGEVTGFRPVAPSESQPKSQESQARPKGASAVKQSSEPATPRVFKLDATSRRALELLVNGPMTTDQLWDKSALNKGREHTSRVMKKLFELGLVTRDDANKPYTYQLTDQGRRQVQ